MFEVAEAGFELLEGGAEAGGESSYMANAMEMGYESFIKNPVAGGMEMMEDFAPEEMQGLEDMFTDMPEQVEDLGGVFEEKVSEVAQAAVDLRQPIMQGVEALGLQRLGAVLY